MLFNRRKKSNFTIGSFVRSLCEACESVTNMYSAKRQEYIESFLEKNEDGTYTDKKVTIDRGDGNTREFSSLALFYTSSPEPDEIIMKTKIAFEDTKNRDMMCKHNGGKLQIADTSCSLTRISNSNKVELEIRFKSKRNDEHIQRLIDHLAGGK